MNADSHDPMTAFKGALTMLQDMGIGQLYPLIKEYAPHLIQEGTKLQDKFDVAVLRWRAGEVPAYEDSNDETPCKAALNYFNFWSDAIIEVKPLAAREAA